MRLVNCRIENFGKLSDENLDFESGLNIIQRENGWGKSTLASFIKVMLYGFSKENVRSDLQNERRKYKPWQGGVYGGSLTFETEGKKYQISRTFGDKEKDDRLEIRDLSSNMVTDKFSSKVGNSLFGIDAESFMRTIFISQADCPTVTTDGINAKLGNLNEVANDINCYEGVRKQLTDILNAMTPNRKTGSLAQTTTKINELYAVAISEAGVENSMADIDRKQRELKEEKKRLENDKKDTSDKLRDLSVAKDLQLKKERYTALCEDVKKKKEIYESKKSFFSKSAVVPELDEFDSIIEKCNEYTKVRATLEKNAFTDDEEKELDLLSSHFLNGCPEEMDFVSKSREIDIYNAKKMEYAKNQLTDEEKESLVNFRRRFEGTGISEEKINILLGKWNTRTEDKQKLADARHCLEEAIKDVEGQKQEKSLAEAKKEKMKSAAIGCAVVFVLSLIFLAGFKLYPAVIVMAVAAAAAVYCVVTYRRTIIKDIDESRVNAANEQIATLEKEISDIRKEAEAFVASTGGMEPIENAYMSNSNNDDLDIPAMLVRLLQENTVYRKLETRNENFLELGLLEECEGRFDCLKEFFEKYGLVTEGDLAMLLGKLQNMALKYTLLHKHKMEYSEDKGLMDSLYGRICNFLDRYGFEPEKDLLVQIMDIREAARLCNTASDDMADAINSKELFEKENDTEMLMQAPDVSDESIAELSSRIESDTERLQNIAGELLELDHELTALSEKREIIDEKKNQLENLREKYDSDSRKYKLLSMTRELLDQSKNSLTAKYTEPVMSGFRKYYELFTGQPADDFLMEASGTLSVREAGMQRNVLLLSAGYRDLIGVAMRMALVDAMYHEEKPFVIFDDPFVNLDEQRMQGAKELVSVIAEKYQVIYFTCNSNRI